MAKLLPKHADVVIVGGGVAGVSIAYHLTKLGIGDVLLLERKQLTCGTTWHAAGLVGQLRATRTMTELAKYSAELFAGLEAETGQATGFKQNGSIFLAGNEARFEELKRGASMGRNFGLEVRIISAGEAGERWPGLNTSDIVGATYLPSDGQINPIDVTRAMAIGARSGGARIHEDCKVTRILCEGGAAVGVETEQGTVLADVVVLCAGLWSRQIGAEIGVSIPLHAAEHFYIVTEPIAGLASDLPVLRSQDEYVYFKEDAGKILLGCFEPVAKPWGMAGVPEDFSFETLPPDFEHFEPILEKAIRRMPCLETAGIQLFFNGPESFTPDDRYLLGEAPELKNLFVATGFNSIGIQSSGGVGKVMAEWIRDRRPPAELSDVDVSRLMPFQSNRQYLHDRTTETLGLLYAIHWPHYQFETARGARRSSLHEGLIAAGAVMGETAGWERPNWYRQGDEFDGYSYSFGRQNWFAAAERESLAVRDQVGLFDQSSFAKFLLQGRDAVACLNRICANNIDQAVGRVIYTQWLNENGGIVADLTVTRLAETEFLVVTGAAAQTRDLAWLRRHIPVEAHCSITDITSGLPMLGLMGPNSRALLQGISPQDFGNDAFPFASSQEIEIGYAKARASRITYVGELGWEIYVPAEFLANVYEVIMAAGQDHGLQLAGYHAMNACRMEKGYRHWGHDIANDDTPIEAGLNFAVAYDKPGGFVGRDALLRQRDAGTPVKRLVQLCLADDSAAAAMMYHEEPIYRNGELVGSTTSGAWGHRLGKSLAMGYVHQPDGVSMDWLESGDWQVEIAMEKFPAAVQLRPWYDPKSSRAKA